MKNSNVLFWLSLTVVIITPFSNDVFISGFPSMKVFFQTEHIGWVISVFLLGLALSQPFYGPLSDRYGRKPVLLVGLIIFLLGSVMTSLSQQFEWFLLARFIQAIGACSTIVSAFAMLRDTQGDDDLVRSMGVLMAFIGICPAVAPLMGALLTAHLGWRSNFTFLLILGLSYLFIISVCFRETHLEKNKLKFSDIVSNYLMLFKNSHYRHYTMVSGLSYGALFAYFSVAGVYLMSMLGFATVTFGWIVFINALIIVIGSIIVPKLSLRVGLKRSLIAGISFIFSGGLLMWLLINFWVFNVYTFMLPMAVVTLGIAFIRPTASAGAMQQAEKGLAGTAASGFNCISFIGGSICSGFSAYLIHSPARYGLFVMVLATIAFASLLFNCKKQEAG